MKRILIITVVVLAGILYLADLVSVRFRIPARDTFGTVTVHTYYVVKLKNGRTEYDYAGDHDISCSNSVFPQFRVKPCWYARTLRNRSRLTPAVRTTRICFEGRCSLFALRKTSPSTAFSPIIFGEWREAKSEPRRAKSASHLHPDRLCFILVLCPGTNEFTVTR